MNSHKKWVLLIFAAMFAASLACGVFSGAGSDEVDPPVVTETLSDDEPGTGDSGDGDNQEGADATTGDGDPAEDSASTGDDEPVGDSSDSGGDASASNGDDPVDDSGSSSSTGDGPMTLNLDDPTIYNQPDSVNTYALNFSYAFSGTDSSGEPFESSMVMEGEVDVENGDLFVEMVPFGPAVDELGGIFTFVQLDGTLYVNTPDFGCISAPEDESFDNPFDAFLDTGGFLMGEANRIFPDEVVNGIDTYVYEITMENIDPDEGAGNDVDDLEEGRIHIDKETGAVVRLFLKGTGQNDVLTGDEALTGDNTYEINYFGFNEPVENINPPEGCEGFGNLSDSEYPVTEDATNIVEFEGLISFNTALTPEEALDFVREGMADAGWSLTTEFGSPDSGVFLTYAMGDRRVTVTITPDDDIGGTQIAYLEDE